jgi:hypothetical protein
VVPLDELVSQFVSGVITDLVRRKIIKEGEWYEPYVYPHYDDKAQFGYESVSVDPTRAAMQNDPRPSWLSEPELRGEPMRYFTIKVCTLPRGLVYTRDCRLIELDMYLDKLQQKLVAEGKISRHSVAMGMQRDLLAQATRNTEAGLIAIVIQGERRQEPEESETSEVDIEIDLTPIEDPGLPRRSLNDYARGALKPLNLGNVVPVIHTSSLQTINNTLHYSERMYNHGILVGYAFENTDTSGYIVEVTGAIPMDSASEQSPYAYFTHDAWQRALDAKDRSFPDERVVGWYQLQVLDIGVTENVVFAHRNFFGEPWQILLCVGAGATVLAAYIWREGQLHVCSNCFTLENS